MDPLSPSSPDRYLQLERLLDEIREIVTDRKTQTWRDNAACAGLGPERFFVGRGERTDLQGAVAVCAECPVVSECHRYAVETRARYGVWGGVGATRIKGVSAGVPMAAGTCAACGTAFDRKNRNQRYCCEECKARRHARLRVLP